MHVNVRTPALADFGIRAKLKSVTSSDPAADTEASITVPAGKYYKIISASINTVQGATQTPLTSLNVTDGTNTVGRFPSASAATTAGVTSQNSWFPGATLTAGAALTSNNGPIPNDLIVGPSWVVSTVTAGKGANTNHGVLVLNVVEFSA